MAELRNRWLPGVSEPVPVSLICVNKMKGTGNDKEITIELQKWSELRFADSR